MGIKKTWKAATSEIRKNKTVFVFRLILRLFGLQAMIISARKEEPRTDRGS